VQMIQVDLSRRQEVSSLAAKISDLGPLDGLVNNAGDIRFELWKDFSITSWDYVMAVNATAPVHLVHALRESFVTGASIVNIASTDGFTGSFGSIAYSASKAALINATKSLGNLMGPTVRVNAVAPGWVDTGMPTDASYGAASDAAVSLTPLSRKETSADIAGVVCFLLSADAAFITGATIVVDGGYTNVDSIMKFRFNGAQS
jgi:NAD(P)-dependent dehydrogenase (short-subunit alcohol dehydrogenase family)